MNARYTHKLTIERLGTMKAWFCEYVRSFYSSDPVVQQAIVLKEKHSLRVCDEILNIGNGLDMTEDELRIAEAMALFHDIGRFEQYTGYGTFVDAKSADHGALGVKVLRREKVLAELDVATRDLILRAVSYHNRLSIPEDESAACVFFTKLLRDADKIDIFKVVSTYYYVGDAERSAAVELDLPDTPGFSAEVLEGVREGRMIRMQEVRSLNDFKLLQLAWVYDLNFSPTFRIVEQRDYLGMIRRVLPPSEAIDRAYSELMDYLREKSREEKKTP